MFTESIFVLLSSGKKAKTNSLKLFKIMAFKNWQQETTKGILKLKTSPLMSSKEKLKCQNV